MFGQTLAKSFGPPPILESAGDLMARYDAIFCDVWGVIHDGVTAHFGAQDALIRFRSSGGTVVLVSNAPVPKGRVAQMLAAKGFADEAFDDIVSSGDIALRHISRAAYRQVFAIGPQDRDSALFNAIAADFGPLETADAIVCTGLNDDLSEVAEDYDHILTRALKRQLPFICANPDKFVDVGGKLYLCAGAIADRYAELGGSVFWAGKPHAAAYGTAMDIAEELRKEMLNRSQVLAIGDAVRTDLKAAATAGVDALFIAGGIHRDDVMDGDDICPKGLATLFASPDASPAVGVMPQLLW